MRNYLTLEELSSDKKLGAFDTDEEFFSALKKSAENSITDKNYFNALKIYKYLEDQKKISSIAKKCLKEGYFLDAALAFEYLGDKASLLKVVKEGEKTGEFHTIKHSLLSYMGQDKVNLLHNKFFNWASAKGVQEPIAFETVQSIKIAHSLADDYDIGVGISRGGLFLTYLFEKFGLKNKLVDAHKKDRNVTFRWMTDFSDADFYGKKVAVIDKDVITGRTSGAVLNKVKKHKPYSIDLILVHNPTKEHYGSLIENVPKGYDDVHYPNQFSYNNFDKACAKLYKDL